MEPSIFHVAPPPAQKTRYDSAPFVSPPPKSNSAAQDTMAACEQDFYYNKFTVGSPPRSGSPAPVSRLEFLDEPLPFDATIPVIDMNIYYTDRARFVSELAAALKKGGFIAIRNSGIDIETLDTGYKAYEAFSRLSTEEKMKVSDPKNNGQRGFVVGERAKGEEQADVTKEFFGVGRDWPEETKEGKYQNIWPNPDIIDLQTPLTNVFHALEKLSDPVLRSMALMVGKDEEYFIRMVKKGDCLMRALRYLPNVPKGTIVAGAHTDICYGTFLPRATTAGLQIEVSPGVYEDVVVPENCVIFNLGDMFQNITNGEYPSVVHRVVAKEDNTERFSMVFFVHPGPEDRLDPLPVCIERTGGEQKFPNCTAGELLDERLIDIGIAGAQLKERLAQTGLIEEMIKYGKQSDRVIKELVEEGYPVSKVIMDEYERLQAAKTE